MAPREDLITSAVSFLQDPSVATSPLEKRIAFLQSKNLTQEEIDLSLSRASDEPATSFPQQPQNGSYYSSPPPQLPQQQQIMYRRPPNQYYNDWPPAPPPELPKRDWRDWFIMATVAGGATYGLWVLTQRYIRPLIAPPTPPQLEQDKAAIDEQFSRAFALLDTLSSDTTALKAAEEARTTRLDAALAEVESVVAELKTASQRREEESRRVESSIKELKDSLPKAIDSVRDGSEKRLKELGRELGSLKLLMGNRYGTNPAPTPAAGIGMSARPQTDTMRSGTTSSSTTTDDSPPTPNTNASTTTPGFSMWNPLQGSSNSASTPSAPAPRPSSAGPSAASSLFGPSSSGGKAAIPAWQMAASNKTKNLTAAGANGSSSSSVNVGGSGSTEPEQSSGSSTPSAS